MALQSHLFGKAARLTLCLLLCLPLTGTGQTEEELKGGGYYYGEAIDKNLYLAKQAALADLANQFQSIVKVTSELAHENGITTFSNNIVSETDVFIQNAHHWTDLIGGKRKGRWHVIAYIGKKELEDAKLAKMTTMLGYVREGDEALKGNDVATALNRYYWATALTASDWMICATRNLDDTGFFVDDFKKKLDDVLSDIRFEAGERVGFASFVVKPAYKGKPVDGLPCRAFVDGKWVPMKDTVIHYNEHVPDSARLSINFGGIQNLKGFTLTSENKEIVEKAQKFSTARKEMQVALPPHDQLVEVEYVPGQRGFVYVFIKDESQKFLVMYGSQYVGVAPIFFDVSVGKTSVTIQNERTGQKKTYRIDVLPGAVSTLLGDM